MSGRRHAVRDVASSTVRLLRDTYTEWRADRTIRLGAGLAYYGLFAAVPLVSVAVALAGVLFSAQDVRSYLTSGLDRVFGSDAPQVASALSTVLVDTGTGVGLGLVGGGTLVVAASFAVVALQDAFNVIWHVPIRAGIQHSIRRHVLAAIVALALGSLLCVSLAVQWVFGLVEGLVPGEVRVLEVLAGIAAVLASWALLAGVLTLLFRFLPRASVGWRAALRGAVVTTLLLQAGTQLLAVYLQRFGPSSLSGAVGGVVLVLVWFYYEAQILLAGAQLTKVLDRRARLSHGGRADV